MNQNGEHGPLVRLWMGQKLLVYGDATASASGNVDGARKHSDNIHAL